MKAQAKSGRPPARPLRLLRDIRLEVELPKYLQLEPVGQCNLRCRMCPIQFRQDGPPFGSPAFMSFELFASLIEGIPGLERLHLQGLGEPMMHPRFFDMVRYASSRGVSVTTNSNLTLLNPRRAAECIDSGLDSLHVSIDGSTAETYERIRIRGHFDRVLRNAGLVSEAKRRLASATPSLHLVMVLMRENLDELPGVVRLAASLGMEEVFVQQLCHDFEEAGLPPQYAPMRAFVESQTLSEDEAERVSALFDEARRVAAAAGLRLRLPSLQRKLHPPGTPGRMRCDWPWSGAYVSYDGQAMPCCMVSTPDRAALGSVAAAGFTEVWDGPAYRDFRNRLDSADPPSVCASCSLYRGTF